MNALGNAALLLVLPFTTVQGKRLRSFPHAKFLSQTLGSLSKSRVFFSADTDRGTNQENVAPQKNLPKRIPYEE